jgi:hypothetical protein
MEIRIDYLENYVDFNALDYKERISQIEERLKSEEVLYPEFKSEITPEELMNYTGRIFLQEEQYMTEKKFLMHTLQEGEEYCREQKLL